MKRLLLGAAAGAALLGLTACAPESKAKDDLEDKYVVTHKSTTDVISSSNSFPNLSHTCWDTTGFWSTTDRLVIIVYNDPICGGTEQPFVVSNIPGMSVVPGAWVGTPGGN